MPFLSAPLSADHVAGIDWWAGLPEEGVPGFALHRHFMAQAEQSGAPPFPREVWLLLAGAALLSFHPTSRAAPFGVMMRDGHQRTSALEDFSPDDVKALALLAPTTQSLSLRARLADVAWEAGKLVGTRIWQMGVLATRSYYHVASSRLMEDSQSEGRGALQRGLELAWQFRKQASDAGDEYWRLVEMTARALVTGEKPHLLMALADECYERKHALALTLAPLLEQGAQAHLRSSGPTLFHAEMWGRAAKLWGIAERPQEAAAARIHEGEGYVAHAEAAPSAMVAGHWIKVGLEVLRQAKANRARVLQVHQRMIELQLKSSDEMARFSQPIDVRELHERVQTLIANKSLEAALFGLAAIDNLIDPQKARRAVLLQIASSPLMAHMPLDLMSSEGAVLARRGPLIGGDPTENEEAIQAAMFEHVKRFDLLLRADVMALRAAQTIYNEHHPSEVDVARYVVGNPFVPEGMTASIVRGLQQGFESDWLAVGTYLIPRMEGLVRHWLGTRGVIVSTVTADGLQKVRSLSELLASPEAAEILGDRFLFELRCHLTEQWGFNLRHDYAHGLLGDSDVVSRGTLSLWWLLWRIILTPSIRAAKDASSSNADHAELDASPE